MLPLANRLPCVNCKICEPTSSSHTTSGLQCASRGPQAALPKWQPGYPLFLFAAGLELCLFLTSFCLSSFSCLIAAQVALQNVADSLQNGLRCDLYRCALCIHALFVLYVASFGGQATISSVAPSLNVSSNVPEICTRQLLSCLSAGRGPVDIGSCTNRPISC